MIVTACALLRWTLPLKLEGEKRTGGLRRVTEPYFLSVTDAGELLPPFAEIVNGTGFDRVDVFAHLGSVF